MLLHAFLLLAAAVPAMGAPATLSVPANLHPTPGSPESSALLDSGTPVTVVEQAAGRVLVRVEGWLDRTALAKGGRGTGVGRVESPSTFWQSQEDSAYFGLLSAGTNVEATEQRSNRVRVTIEGWVDTAALPLEALTQAAASPPGAGAAASSHGTAGATAGTSAPSAAGSSSSASTTAAVAALGNLVGSVRARQAGSKKTGGAGTRVWLLPPDADLEVAADPADAARLEQLDADLARIDAEMSKARWDSDLARSASRRLELERRRDVALAERAAALSARHGVREARARELALVETVADENGNFALAAIAAGRYQLYARLTRDDADVDWLQALEIGTATTRVALDERGADGL